MTVTLTAGAVTDFTWNQGADHPAKSGGGEPFFEFARRCTFLDYKALLKTSLAHEDNDHVNLFPLLVESLIRDVKMPDGKLSVSGQWQAVGKFPPQPKPQRETDESNDDFQERLEGWKSPEEQIADEAKSFRDQLDGILNTPKVGIVTRANDLLARLATGIVLKLKVGDLKLEKLSSQPDQEAHKFSGADITLACDYCGHPVDHPPQFLNEARLTAMALALYFAGAEASTPKVSGGGASRLLVLDDVLIGLDLSNRIPVLRLLEEEFKDWQVLLLTYDRVWFDLAQEYTEQSKRWTYLKLLELPTTPGSYSIPLIEPHSSLTKTAEKHWNTNDYMAAAVYVRAALESRIRNVCRDHGIEIAYKPDPKDVTASKLWEGIVARQTKRQADGKPDFIAPALMQDVETVRSTVLNRLSHSGSPTLVKNEVKFALDTVKTLEHHPFKKNP